MVAGNHEFKKTVSINSVQSFLKSHSVWVTLYINIFLKRYPPPHKSILNHHKPLFHYIFGTNSLLP